MDQLLIHPRITNNRLDLSQDQQGMIQVKQQDTDKLLKEHHLITQHSLQGKTKTWREELRI